MYKRQPIDWNDESDIVQNLETELITNLSTNTTKFTEYFPNGKIRANGSLDKNGKLVVVHACGGDPGNKIVKKIWPKEKPFPSLYDSFVKYIKSNTDKEFLRELKFHKKQKIKYILRALPNEISVILGTLITINSLSFLNPSNSRLLIIRCFTSSNSNGLSD